MTTYLRYLDDIQTAVGASDMAEPDFLRESAAEYAEACAEVNKRLREVGILLHQGLRSEAIQLAEQEPDLLNMVTQLDFPELGEWLQLLKGWGMVGPPALLRDLTAQLNEAYAQQQPLVSLLKTHRRQALTRAALSKRITTLRKILQLDPDNDAWQTDLGALERARLKEILTAAQQASSRDDLEELAALQEEIQPADWSIPVSADLVDQISGLHRRLSRNNARGDLKTIADELTAAHSAFDGIAGREARARWQEAIDIATLAGDDPLVERAAPALEWLDEEDERLATSQRRDIDLETLETALDQNDPREKLERIYYRLSHYEEGVPQSLEQRYFQRIASFELARKRRQVLLLASIVGTVILIGAITTSIFMRRARARAVAEHSATLKVLIDEDNLTEAESQYKDLESAFPGVARSPEVQREFARLTDALRKEKERQATFKKAMQRARKAGVQKPDWRALDDAGELAKTDAEKVEVNELKSRIDAYTQNSNQQDEKTFTESLTQLQRRLTNLESNNVVEDARGDSKLQHLLNDIATAVAVSPGISDSLRAQGNTLTVRVKALLAERKLQHEFLEARDRLTESVGHVEAFLSALKDLRDRFPEKALGLAHDQLKDESSLWVGMDQWSDYLRQPVFRNLSSLIAGEATGLLEQGDALLLAHPSIPLREFYDDKKPFLESVKRRETGDGEPLQRTLEDLLRDPVISLLWMVERQDGTRYYSTKEPDDEAEQWVVHYITDFDLGEKVLGIPKKGVVYSDRAPQSKFAEKAKSHLEQLRPSTWERNFFRILRDLDKEPRMDPVLRLSLWQQVLEPACEGSVVLAELFSEHRRRIRAADVDLSVEWMHPRDDLAKAARLRAKAELADLPRLNETVKNAKAVKARYVNSTVPSYTWIGWLGSDHQGSWNVFRPDHAATSGDLVILQLAAGGTRARFLPIGTLEQGTLKRNHRRPDAFLEGRPVFLQEVSSKTVTAQEHR